VAEGGPRFLKHLLWASPGGVGAWCFLQRSGIEKIAATVAIFSLERSGGEYRAAAPPDVTPRTRLEYPDFPLN